MSAPADAREWLLIRRFVILNSTDGPRVFAQADPTITAGRGHPGVVLADVMGTATGGYSEYGGTPSGSSPIPPAVLWRNSDSRSKRCQRRRAGRAQQSFILTKLAVG